MPPLGARGVEIHPGDPGLGIPLGQHPLELLGPDPAHLLHRVGADPAGERQRLLMPAVVAAEAVGARWTVREMLHRGHCQTSPQSGHWRKAAISPPIEQEQRLFPPRQGAGTAWSSASDQATGPVPATFGATRRSTSSTGGSGREPIRCGRRSELQAAGPCGPSSRARAWRCPARSARSLEPGADRGDVPRVVARRLAVLVAGLVLLVHHDESQIGHRREHRRPRPHRDPALAPAQKAPGVGALPVGERAVQHRDLVAEGARGAGSPSAA